MADVTRKIKSGNIQPNEGRIVLQPQWANPTAYQTISPPINRGLSITQFDDLLTDRFDRPRYYTSTPSGLAY